MASGSSDQNNLQSRLVINAKGDQLITEEVVRHLLGEAVSGPMAREEPSVLYLGAVTVSAEAMIIISNGTANVGQGSLFSTGAEAIVRELVKCGVVTRLAIVAHALLSRRPTAMTAPTPPLDATIAGRACCQLFGVRHGCNGTVMAYDVMMFVMLATLAEIERRAIKMLEMRVSLVPLPATKVFGNAAEKRVRSQAEVI